MRVERTPQYFRIPLYFSKKQIGTNNVKEIHWILENNLIALLASGFSKGNKELSNLSFEYKLIFIQ